MISSFHQHHVWIYSLNLAIIGPQLYLIPSFLMFALNKWTTLIPIKILHIESLVLLGSSCFQVLVCVFGLVGVFIAKKRIVRFYYVLLVPCILLDMCLACAWAFKLANVHKDFDEYINQSVFEPAVCETFASIQAELNCHTPEHILSFCNATDVQVVPSYEPILECSFTFMRWMQHKTDGLGFLAFFLLMPLKIFACFTLRDDIKEIFSDISYARDNQRYKHWANDEEDEEVAHKKSLFHKNDGDGDSNNSRESNLTLLNHEQLCESTSL